MNDRRFTISDGLGFGVRTGGLGLEVFRRLLSTTLVTISENISMLFPEYFASLMQSLSRIFGESSEKQSQHFLSILER